jgi:hypothetical protein
VSAKPRRKLGVLIGGLLTHFTTRRSRRGPKPKNAAAITPNAKLTTDTTIKIAMFITLAGTMMLVGAPTSVRHDNTVVDLAKDPVRQGSLATSTTVKPEHLAA